MTRLIHLNGPPGVGKTTLARRYAADHPGVLLCDIDVLRTMIGDWQDDADAASRARTAGLALITGYLSTGHDVVLPQTVGRGDELARFRAAAQAAAAEHVHIVLVAHPDVVVDRFRRRAATLGDAWTTYATAYVDGEGGDAALREWTSLFDGLPADLRVPSTDPDATYAALLEALG
ncbi:MAG TPA: AAA family ATPase [Nocardioides sp.]|uniref:AAA family ATPase n=1 Tax=Nocardioides sp. TaxID=35761 RepID=UPI002F40A367